MCVSFLRDTTELLGSGVTAQSPCHRFYSLIHNRNHQFDVNTELDFSQMMCEAGGKNSFVCVYIYNTHTHIHTHSSNCRTPGIHI